MTLASISYEPQRGLGELTLLILMLVVNKFLREGINNLEALVSGEPAGNF